MKLAWSTPTSAHRLMFAGLALASLAILAGCDSDGYPTEMRYPLRSDPLVTDLPTSQPAFLDRPGELFRLYQTIRSAGGKVLEPDGFTVDPATQQRKAALDLSLRKQVDEVLFELFGTPAEPAVRGIPPEQLKELQLRPLTLAEGSVLYRRHCLHCHGLAGDGRGPTAPWVNPHPRDYRLGIFKFTSTRPEIPNRKPRRDDLVRTIRMGIEGTSMPAFGLLADLEQEELASYVMHLALRGEVEFQTLKEILNGTLELAAGSADARQRIAAAAKEKLEVAADSWTQAQAPESLIQPVPYPYPDLDEPGLSEDERDRREEALRKSIARGKNAFDDDKVGGCIKCHEDYGRRSNIRYDEWGTIVKPQDLTQGIYRGGRRRVDLYYRVYGGIRGAGMLDFRGLSSQHPDNTADRKDKIDKIWDMVNFLQVLPYPHLRARYEVKID